LKKLLADPSLKSGPVKQVMDKPFEWIAPETPLEQVNHMLEQSRSALMCPDADGRPQIITKHDIIKAIC
jgi:cystathionine beta-synthase